MDLGDGYRDIDGITKELAMEFGIDPDEIDSLDEDILKSHLAKLEVLHRRLLNN